MPKVSVIMSIYKEPIDWIRQSIDSVLCQTFTDFEFLIVNDNPDRIENTELLEEYVKKDLRITTINNEANIGLTKSLNKALAIALGEYIARMDADDISLQDRFEQQVMYLDDHSTVIAVGSWVVDINEVGDIIGHVSKCETNPRWVRASFIQNSQIIHPTAMFRRIVDGRLMLYDSNVAYAQDYSLWVNLLSYGDVISLPKILLWYRVSGKQITADRFFEQQECAKVAKRKVFALFDLPVSDCFFEIYHNLSISMYEIPFEKVTFEVKSFFKQVHYTIMNSLVLELVYSTYVAYLNSIGGNTLCKLYRNVKYSSLFMQYLGIKFYIHLALHRICNRLSYE